MHRILFVCHGNICRSPMAEFILKDKVSKRGLSHLFTIASAATSSEELGQAVYPPARRELAAHGIECQGKLAVKVASQDYDAYDYLIVMDDYNLRNLKRITQGDPQHKISKLLDFTTEPGDVADPWYTGDFQKTFRHIAYGCEGLLAYLKV